VLYGICSIPDIKFHTFSYLDRVLLSLFSLFSVNLGDYNSPDIIQKSFAELDQLLHDSNHVFQTAAEGVKDTLGDEAKEKKFLSTLKQQLRHSVLLPGVSGHKP
jgi:hypothetical protein